jgi:hypothetical protein
MVDQKNSTSPLSQHLATATSIGLIGSCVARDFKEVACGPDVHASYLWRSGTVSMATPPAPPAISIDQLGLSAPSLKTIENDLLKQTLTGGILKNDFVFMDFFRDTYDLVALESGTYVTFGKEVSDEQMKHLFPNSKLKSVYDADYPDLWFSCMMRVADIINDSDAIVVIVPCIASYGIFANNRFEALEIDSFDAYYKHAMLEFMEMIAARMLKKSILLKALHAGVSCDPKHVFGVGPFHHHAVLYRRMLKINDLALEDLLKRHVSDRSDIAECKRILALWRDIAGYGYPLANSEGPVRQLDPN